MKRKCGACHQWRELNADNFYRSSRPNSGGFRTTCKFCHYAEGRSVYRYTMLTWHLPHPLYKEQTLCGKLLGPTVYAAIPGQFINCADCRKVIKFCRKVSYFRHVKREV